MHMGFWDTYTERIFLRGLTRTRGEGYMAACGLFLVFFGKKRTMGEFFQERTRIFSGKWMSFWGGSQHGYYKDFLGGTVTIQRGLRGGRLRWEGTDHRKGGD